MLLQLGNSCKTTLSQTRVQSRTCPSAEERPRAPTRALVRSLPTPLPKGLGELCCQTAFSWGKQSSPRAPNPRRQRTPALCRTSQHRLQQNLRAYFSGAFKVGANNIKLILRGSHWSSLNHLRFHVLPSVHQKYSKKKIVMQLLTLSVPPAAERGQVGRILPQILQQRALVLGEMSKEFSEHQYHAGQILLCRMMYEGWFMEPAAHTYMLPSRPLLVFRLFRDCTIKFTHNKREQ